MRWVPGGPKLTLAIQRQIGRLPAFQFVRITRKASDQISQHRRHGISEEYVKNRVRFAPTAERNTLPDGSYRPAYRVKRGESRLRVEIFVREQVHDDLIREFVVYGVHTERAEQ